MGIDASAGHALAFAALIEARYRRELATGKITPEEVRADCAEAVRMLTQDTPRLLDADFASHAHGILDAWVRKVLAPQRQP